MKRLLENHILLLAARLIFGGLLIYASYDKILDPDAFGKAVWNYKIFSRGISLGIATVLPWMELLSGAAIILGIFFRGAALLSLLMMLAFTGGVISGLARGLDISCGCFSLDPNVGKIGWMKILENLGLVLAAAFLFFSNSDKFMLETRLQRLRTEAPQQVSN
jgi:uncharacterized membrane protein YphA (DoxX/SURF4 family)